MLINARTGAAVARTVEIADTHATRRRGLLGREAMATGSALLITPCFAIHTAFMRFAIDVMFIDRDGRVVRIVRNLTPWRMAIAVRARSVVEMPGGALQSCDVRLGDRLYLAPDADATDDVKTAA